MATQISVDALGAIIEDTLKDHLSKKYDEMVEQRVSEFRSALMEEKAGALVAIFAKVMEHYQTMDSEIQISIPLRLPGM